MKTLIKKIFILYLFTFTVHLFAENKLSKEWNFRLVTDAAYYPKSDFVPGDDHFAPITGLYDLFVFRITANAEYLLPINFGDHWLFEESNILFQTSGELTPVTFRTQQSFIFLPVPFFELQTGFALGLGWNFGSIISLYEYNQVTHQYQKLSTFKNVCLEYFFKATLQFDLGAVLPGDWKHVLMIIDYKAFYRGLTNVAEDSIYTWQATKGLTNGWQYDSNIIIGYQLPLKFYRTGFITEFTGYYASSAYEQYNANFNGGFCTISISPFFQIKFEENNTLSILLEFSSRRSFKEPHKLDSEELTLTYAGREWFFNRIGLSWDKTF